MTVQQRQTGLKLSAMPPRCLVNDLCPAVGQKRPMMVIMTYFAAEAPLGGQQLVSRAVLVPQREHGRRSYIIRRQSGVQRCETVPSAN